MEDFTLKTQFSCGAADVQEPLVRKLNPRRFPNMSARMAAILGYILGSTFTEPALAEVVVTSDGFVLAQSEGEVGANRFIGKYVDVFRNWCDLMAVAGLTVAERIEAEARYAAKIGHYGRLAS
jgi:hypothetical protein